MLGDEHLSVFNKFDTLWNSVILCALCVERLNQTTRIRLYSFLFLYSVILCALCVERLNQTTRIRLYSFIS